MRNKKIVVLIVLVIAAAASIIYGIVTPPGWRWRIEQKKEVVLSEEKKGDAPAAPVRAGGHAVKSKFASWKRRPFVPTDVPGTLPNLILNGILASGNNPKAIISGNIVGKGGKVGSSTVVDIRKDSVILNDGTKDFELKLKE